jgi:hypothetical protein
MKPVSAAMALLFAVSCGPPAPTIADDQVSGLCPSGTPLTGTGVPGDGCSRADLDCEPVCCSCSNGDGDSFLAAECYNGACQGPGAACADVESSDGSLCP